MVSGFLTLTLPTWEQVHFYPIQKPLGMHFPVDTAPFKCQMIPQALLKVFIMVYKDIVSYCICYSIYNLLSHILSRHLNGAVLETLSRPSLLITDAYNALNVQARRRERDTQLMSMWTYCTLHVTALIPWTFLSQ